MLRIMIICCRHLGALLLLLYLLLQRFALEKDVTHIMTEIHPNFELICVVMCVKKLTPHDNICSHPCSYEMRVQIQYQTICQCLKGQRMAQKSAQGNVQGEINSPAKEKKKKKTKKSQKKSKPKEKKPKKAKKNFEGGRLWENIYRGKYHHTSRSNGF